MKQQINTFEELFPHIDKNGVYLCEDLHTSYRKGAGGGYKKKERLSNTVKTLLTISMHGIPHDQENYRCLILPDQHTHFIITIVFLPLKNARLRSHPVWLPANLDCIWIKPKVEQTISML